MQTTSCTWPYVVPISEDLAAHGHWCAFTDLYHTIPYTTFGFVHRELAVARLFSYASNRHAAVGLASAFDVAAHIYSWQECVRVPKFVLLHSWPHMAFDTKCFDIFGFAHQGIDRHFLS